MTESHLSLIRLLAEIQGVFQILEIQQQPLTKAQQLTLENFISRIEIKLNEMTGKVGE